LRRNIFTKSPLCLTGVLARMQYRPQDGKDCSYAERRAGKNQPLKKSTSNNIKNYIGRVTTLKRHRFDSELISK